MELFVQLLINGLFSSVNGTRRVRKTNMSKVKYVDLFIIIVGENVSHVEEFHIEVKEIKAKTVLKSELPQAKMRCLVLTMGCLGLTCGKTFEILCSPLS